ncbi:hypothetical protein LWI29_035566 [Acer saccharum]|uniref:PB1 domain-containing protein n=1 Tax=Acer saccharum TaxID=4024 RepID=A0AA39S373_ACESA|nr:hypothetical protein LWI29_035566 [Acer saccharum]
MKILVPLLLVNPGSESKFVELVVKRLLENDLLVNVVLVNGALMNDVLHLEGKFCCERERESNEFDNAEKSVAWPPQHEDEKIDVVSGSRRYGSENQICSQALGRHEPDLLSSFRENADSSHGYSPSFVDQSLPSARKSLLDQDGKFSLLARPWSLMPSSLSLKLAESSMKIPGQSGDVTSVDLSKLNNYDELIAELFEFGGELMAPKKNWLIEYTDDEGDMMLVGDTDSFTIHLIIFNIFFFLIFCKALINPWLFMCKSGNFVAEFTSYTREDEPTQGPKAQSVRAENPLGTPSVEGIILDNDRHRDEITHLKLNGKSFSGMSNLRLLIINDVDVHLFEDLEYLSNELRLLEWHGYPLKSLPSSFQLQRLVQLSLCYSRIEYIWKDIKPSMKYLKIINLSFSHNLIKTPDFEMIPNLERLDLQCCTKLRLSSLGRLDVSDCNLLEIPSDIGSLFSLRQLLVSGNNFVSLPDSISQLSRLRCLCLEKCQRLQSLPKLPHKIRLVKADDCTSLKTISSALEVASERVDLRFFNCFELVESQGRNISLEMKLLKHWLQIHEISHPNTLYRRHPLDRLHRFHVLLPGSEIPELFSYWSEGSTITWPPLHCLLNDELIGFCACAVMSISDHTHDVYIYCQIDNYGALDYFCKCQPNSDSKGDDHLWLIYFPKISIKLIDCGKGVTVEFGVRENRSGKEYSDNWVKRCGILPVYKQDVEYLKELSATDGAITMPSTLQGSRSRKCRKCIKKEDYIGGR